MLTIKDLYYSDVSILELSRTTKEQDELREKYFELTKQITAQLTEEQLRLHNRIVDVIGQMDALANATHYTQGFRDGAAIMMDIYNE